MKPTRSSTRAHRGHLYAALLMLLCIVGVATATPAQASTAMQASTITAQGDVMGKALTGSLPNATTIHEYTTSVGQGRTLVFGAIALSSGLTLSVQVYRAGESQPSACSRTGVTDAVVLCYRDFDDASPLDNNPNRVQISASAGTGNYIVFARGMGTYASGSNTQLTIAGGEDSDALVAGTHKAFVFQPAANELNVRLCLRTSDANQLSLIKARAYDGTGAKICQENSTCAQLNRNALYYAFTINASTTQVNGVKIKLARNSCS